MSLKQKISQLITFNTNTHELTLRLLIMHAMKICLCKRSQKTKGTEKVVNKFVSKGENLTTEDIEREYPSFDPEITDRITPEITDQITQMCHQPSSIEGSDLSHLWFDKEKCVWDLYCGSICDVKKTTKKNKQKETVTTYTYTIEYWLPGCPEDSHKCLLTLTQLVTDLILGDLVFT